MIVVAREIAYRPWKNVHHPLHKTLYGVCRMKRIDEVDAMRRTD
jgi:hypothetical protein